MEFFGSDHIGIGQRQQTRWLSLLSRMTAETGLSNRQVMVMIEGSLMDAVGNKGYTPFRKDFLTEMFSEGDKMVTGNELAHKIASSIKRNQLMGIQEANVYGAAIHYKKHWMTNQYHNAEAMAKANGDDWVRDVPLIMNVCEAYGVLKVGDEIIIDENSKSEMKLHINLDEITEDLPSDIAATVEAALSEALKVLPEDIDIKIEIKSNK
jgi:hypothetical protein